MDELMLYWLETLARDLAGVADPRSAPAIRDRGREILASWIQQGKVHDARFVLTDEGDFRWMGANGEETYRSFLASPDIGNLDQLAYAISRSIDRLDNYVSGVAAYEHDRTADPIVGPSDHLLLTSTAEALADATGKTQLVFVKADAGAGKTTLLRELTRRQAEAFLRGDTHFLYFFLSAQGRALSNLRDAFSGELDDLRAVFTRDAVPALVRSGLLIPIIDGFDELLGAAGYGDAFGSLHQFLAELQGQGVVVVSARSSFYDIEFVGRRSLTSAQGAAFQLAPFTLQPWGEDELRHFLALARGVDETAAGDAAAVEALDERDRALLQKPFFANQFLAYVDRREADGAQSSLRDFLIERYVGRESEKIVDRDGHPLLVPEGHRLLFREAAEQMWISENRRLSGDDLATLAEMVAEEFGISGDSTRQLMTKITSYAGFSTGFDGPARDFGFEHEVYFDHFLSRSLATRLERGTLDAAYLNSGVLPDEIVELALDGPAAEIAIERLSGIATPAGSAENLRRNAGSIVAASARVLGELHLARVRDAHFVNVSFGSAIFTEVTFDRCVFTDVRLVATRFRQCDARECYAERLVLSSESEFGIAGLEPGKNIASIQYFDGDAVSESFAPTRMTEILIGLGAPLEPAEQTVEWSELGGRLAELLERFVHLFRNANVVCQDDGTPAARRVFLDGNWPRLEGLLVGNGVVTTEARAASGPRKTWYRAAVPFSELMRYQNESRLPEGELGQFWADVRRAQH